jgi:hypothetical protein
VGCSDRYARVLLEQLVQDGVLEVLAKGAWIKGRGKVPTTYCFKV